MKFLRLSNQISFTLIEVLLYLAIFSFLTLMIFGFLYRTEKKFFELTEDSNSFIRTAVAFDCLRRDLQCASNNQLDWDTENFVLKRISLNCKGEVEPIDIGWQVRDKGLFRISGVYDFINKKWISRSYSFLGDQIKSIKLNLLFSKKGGLVVASKIMWKTIDWKFAKNKQMDFVEIIPLENRVI